MALGPRRLSIGRAEVVEASLRARAEQLTPAEPQTSRATPLGLCRTCQRIVYAGERFVMPGIYVFHSDCAPDTDPAGEGRPDQARRPDERPAT